MASVLIGSIPGWEETGQDRVEAGFGPKWGARTLVGGIFRLPRERARVSQLIDDLEVQIFHLQFKREQIGFTGLLSRRAPVVWTEHGTFPEGVKGAILALGYRLAARRVSAIVCVSERVAASVRKVVGSGPRVEVIRNAVDTSILRPPTEAEKLGARESLLIPEGMPVMLWIGRLHKDKLPGIAISLGSAWRGIVIVAGDGEMYDELRRSTDVLAPNVRLMGHVGDPSILYRAADVMVFTSTGAGEGFPTTLIEAAAHGLPVLTNAQSGFGAMVQAAGGAVLPTDSAAEDWIASAERIINSDSSSLARNWSLSYDIEDWVNAHEVIFESVRS
ncbi:glycosyltransferase family 4 protein [Arthrobacter sp. FW306-2-2C-D06B]|uniref:glycosyltransferase family 4 protein n=1 Tax=Arthrobacter sp. FW306-2-2C-D06B TaxID=2879618 RepID=UPI001F21515C|nr:glycosyltransferase family 4 protein [Arthrobacter sp. FW306-2-2C-D06B]